MANMEVTLNVMNLEPVKNMTGILADVLSDERISDDIKQEYRKRVDAIEWEGESDE